MSEEIFSPKITPGIASRVYSEFVYAILQKFFKQFRQNLLQAFVNILLKYNSPEIRLGRISQEIILGIFHESLTGILPGVIL